MNQSMLYEPPKDFTSLLDQLADKPELDTDRAALLMQVELAFELMWFLGLEEEPITSVWIVLSGTPVRHPSLENLGDAARRAIANVRQISPYSAKFAWIDALREYRDLPEKWRNYDLLDNNNIEIDLSEHSIRDRRNVRQKVQEQVYKNCLKATLNYERRPLASVRAGDVYEFRSKKEGGEAHLSVSFSTKDLSRFAKAKLDWLPSQPCKTNALSVSLADLEAIAQDLDKREKALAKEYQWPAEKLGNWAKRLKSVNFRKVKSQVEPAAQLENANSQTIEVDGFLHIAGMVGSGKTTLIVLLAIYLYQTYPEQRTTLVVGDVQSAIQLANQMNVWFCTDPENHTPVATPIFGKSQTDKNQRSFAMSRDYQDYKRRRQPHWGERWLSTVCPLQGQLDSHQVERQLGGLPLVPGTEPCHSLKEPKTGSRRFRGRSYGCPFFGACPSKQMYHDLPTSSIWITTPGAMAMARLPRQLEDRRIKVGELVYEHSNIVVFDEVETVVQWFDNSYAKMTVLANEKDGVFDKSSVATESYLNGDRVPSAATQRWADAERDSLKAITATLTMLSKSAGHKYLQEWVARGYFTPYILLTRFARRLAGLEEFDKADVPEAEQTKNRKAVNEIMSHFERLIEDELFEIGSSASPKTVRLSLIVQQISRKGGSAVDLSIHRACVRWITDFYSETEEKLLKLKKKIKAGEKVRKLSQGKRKSDDVDNLKTLAYRLQFSLTVCLLDYHARTTLFKWQNSPPTVEDEGLHRRLPAGMMNILSLPTTGRQFGTYYAEVKADDKRPNNVLSMFAYTNIGRQYVLNFHRLLTDFDGRRGPNVLGLSGTSYLPHSTQFHLNVEPKGVLLPSVSADRAIAQSSFHFIPQYTKDKQQSDKPIRLSGVAQSQKKEMFQEIVRSLVKTRKDLPKTLKHLRTLATKEKGLWEDRERILLLVNSYEQALWAANELYRCWPQGRGQIYHLARSIYKSGASASSMMGSDRKSQPLQRSDIESFAQATKGKVLVAPLSSIGRGFNILNSKNQAAFGAVYFLTRPYPHPQDAQAIAQEMNRRSIDWMKKAEFSAWEEDGLSQRGNALRRIARRYWRLVEQRSYYKTLIDDDERRPYEEKLGAYPRKDLAATTLGLVIQAVGRLLRGGVPFQAYFVDAAWAPNSADPNITEPDTDKTSLLVAMLQQIDEYAKQPVGNALYKPLAQSLRNTENVHADLS